MTPEQLEHLARRFNVYRSTIYGLPHPVDDLPGWHRRWAAATVLADEVTRLAGPPPGPLPRP